MIVLRFTEGGQTHFSKRSFGLHCSAPICPQIIYCAFWACPK